MITLTEHLKTRAEMATLTRIDARDTNIHNLAGLEYATGLIRLYLAGNSISDVSPTADFNGDGTVGISDFLLFATRFGLSRGDAGYDARFDLDGTIGIGDFLIFVDAFGK